jgi:hypothetical protein
MSPDCDDLLENISSDWHSRPHFGFAWPVLPDYRVSKLVRK